MDITQVRIPQQLAEFRWVFDRRDFRSRLRKQIRKMGIHLISVPFFCLYYNKLRFTACCRIQNCSWKMMYVQTFVNYDKKNGENITNTNMQLYYLVTFSPYHNHHVLFSSFDSLLFNEQQVLKQRNFYLIYGLKDLNIPERVLQDYWSRISGNFISGTKTLLKNKNQFFQNMPSFQSWYYSAIRNKFEIITIPTFQSGHSTPDIIIITNQKAKKSFAEKGSIVRVKIIKKAVMELASNNQEIHILVIYRLKPDQTFEIYYVGLYPHQIKYVQKLEANNNNYQNKKQEQQRKKNKHRIDISLYKVFKIFLKIMRQRICTFIIDDEQQVINTVKYLIYNNKTLNKSENNWQIKYAIDPSLYLSKNLPASMIPTAKQLYSCYSYQQYDEKYRKQMQTLTSKQDRQALAIIHSRRHHFLSYIDSRACLGNWFGWHLYYIRSIQPNMAALMSILKMFTTITKQKDLATYQNVHSYFTKKIAFIAISKKYQDQSYNRYRTTLYKNGFINLMTQIYASYPLSFVDPIIIQVKSSYQRDQNNTNVMTQPDNFSVVTNSMDKQQQMYENNNNQRCSDLSSLPFWTYYQKLNAKQKSEKMSEISDNIDDSNSTQKYPTFNHANINTDQQKSNLNPQYATYQELYPLRPATNIIISKNYPDQLSVWEQGKLYICKKSGQFSAESQTSTQKQPIYSCSCNFDSIMGLPCRHIIKVCMKFKLNFQKYISNLWVLDQFYNQIRERYWRAKGLQTPTIGRRCTKRNRMRNR